MQDGFSLLDPNTFSSYVGEDLEWAKANIPFFECSDTEFMTAYYYRWQTYK